MSRFLCWVLKAAVEIGEEGRIEASWRRGVRVEAIVKAGGRRRSFLYRSIQPNI